MRLSRSTAYGLAAIVLICLSRHMALRATEPVALFHPDPRHVSNRLYREVHVRTDPDGKEYGFDALDPLLWSQTDYLLSGKSHAEAIALADEFLRIHAEREITDRSSGNKKRRDPIAPFPFASNASYPA